MLGFIGIWSLIVGINATKATINVARLWILLPRLFYWKNKPKFIIAKSHNGKNIVAIDTIGNL